MTYIVNMSLAWVGWYAVLIWMGASLGLFARRPSWKRLLTFLAVLMLVLFWAFLLFVPAS